MTRNGFVSFKRVTKHNIDTETTKNYDLLSIAYYWNMDQYEGQVIFSNNL